MDIGEFFNDLNYIMFEHLERLLWEKRGKKPREKRECLADICGDERKLALGEEYLAALENRYRYRAEVAFTIGTDAQRCNTDKSGTDFEQISRQCGPYWEILDLIKELEKRIDVELSPKEAEYLRADGKNIASADEDFPRLAYEIGKLFWGKYEELYEPGEE